MPGDFAVSLRSFQGGIEYSEYTGIISPAYTVLRPKIEVDHAFYRHFFKSQIFIKKYLDISVIGIRDGKQISMTDFITTRLPIPSIKVQRRIGEILDTTDLHRQELIRLRNSLSMQKEGLMQKLLTGEIRVKV